MDDSVLSQKDRSTILSWSLAEVQIGTLIGRTHDVLFNTTFTKLVTESVVFWRS